MDFYLRIILSVVCVVAIMALFYFKFCLDEKRKIIKEYKSLMNALEYLIARDKSMSAWYIVMDVLNKKTDLHLYKVYLFNEKGKSVNAAFYGLKSELESLIRSPHKLWKVNTLSIGEKFKNIVIGNKEMYGMFIKMIDKDIVRKNWFNYEAVKTQHENFYTLLRYERSRVDYDELQSIFEDEFFAPLPEPQNRYLVY